jgi:hypothetical protein
MTGLEVRRFFCGNAACELRTFAEQVPGVALALAGRPGARLARALGIAISWVTVTRLKRGPDGAAPLTCLDIRHHGAMVRVPLRHEPPRR